MLDLKITDKKFYRSMLFLAIPIALQNLITASLNMIDTVMIGKLGESAIASVGIANQVFFLLMLILFGVNSGVSIFIAQFWGINEVKNIKKSVGIAIILGTIVSLIFLLAVFLFSENIISIFSTEAKVVQLTQSYLAIVCLSYPICAVSFSYGICARSINQAMLQMVVSGICLVINACLNYILIFGKLGLPAMGVSGAALATLIARIFELVIIFGFIYSRDHPLKVGIKDFKSISEDFVKKIFKKATPVVLNEAFWALGMVMYSIAYAKVGTSAIAASQISNTVQNIFMVISMGLGNACAVMLGNELGGGRSDLAIKYAKKFSKLGVSIGVVVGAMLFFLIPFILSLFNISEELYSDVAKMLMILSIFMCIRTFNVILILGILRSGGDTRYSLILELASVWLIGVPLAFLGAYLKLPIYIIILLVSIEEIVKSIFGFTRVVSKKWVNNLVRSL